MSKEKQEAERLIELFLPYCDDDDSSIEEAKAKSCAAICVKEIIAESLEWNQQDVWESRDIYWYKVLEHIKQQ